MNPPPPNPEFRGSGQHAGESTEPHWSRTARAAVCLIAGSGGAHLRRQMIPELEEVELQVWLDRRQEVRHLRMAMVNEQWECE